MARVASHSRCFWGVLLGVLFVYQSSFAQTSEMQTFHKGKWKSGHYVEALAELEGYLEEELTPSFDLVYDRAQLRFIVGRVDEAIADMELVIRRSYQPQPRFFLDLALMNQYRGNEEQFDRSLEQAINIINQNRWVFRDTNENVAAVGYIHELVGNNPKAILSTLFDVFFDHPRFTANEISYVGAGDLAYRQEGYDVAEGYYLKALEYNAEYQPALAGLMECYWKSNDVRFTQTLEKLLALNASHPRAHRVLLHRALELSDTVTAQNHIDVLAKINPNHPQLLGYQSVVHFLNDDSESIQRNVQRALAVNPMGSEVYRILGELASRHYRFREGLAFQQQALEINPDDLRARELYALDLLRLGREKEARVELDRVFAENPYSVLSYNLLEMMDTLITFDTIDFAHVQLKMPASETPVMAEPMGKLLDEALVHFEKKYDVTLKKPVLIELFDNHDDFMVRSVGLPGNVGHLGICFGELITMDAPSVRPRGSSNWRSVLWHEFVHVITLQKTNNRMPRWLSEGISVYEEARYSPAFRNRLSSDFVPIVEEDGIPALADLDGLFTHAKSPSHLGFGYFMAGEFVQFYVDAFGFDALVEALEAIGSGEKTLPALCTAANQSSSEVDTAFQAYMVTRLLPLDELGDEGAFRLAMMEAAEAMGNEQWEKALATFKKAYALYPDSIGPDNPLRKQVVILKELGREQDYVTTLESLLMNAPSDIGAAESLLEYYAGQQDNEAILRVTDWALGIDPYSPELYTTQLDALVSLGKHTKALEQLAVLEVLDSAHKLEYRLQKARSLKALHEQEQAKRTVLTLLEEVPHYWDAQLLLLELNGL